LFYFTLSRQRFTLLSTTTPPGQFRGSGILHRPALLMK